MTAESEVRKVFCTVFIQSPDLMREQIEMWAQHGRVFQNGLTFAELEQIEEAAHHSDSDEAKVILRIAAALREAMQIEENALALMSMTRPVSEDKAADSVRQKDLADAKEIR